MTCSFLFLNTDNRRFRSTFELVAGEVEALDLR